MRKLPIPIFVLDHGVEVGVYHSTVLTLVLRRIARNMGTYMDNVTVKQAMEAGYAIRQV